VVVLDKERTLLKVAGSDQSFVLKEAPDPQPREGAATPVRRLREALDRGEKVASVAGRLDGVLQGGSSGQRG
jgi:hypothetical protein